MVADAVHTEETVPLREHLRLVQEQRDRFYEERDRRYTEVGIEREKALKIKETADLAALSLARDIQIYKDEKANELRSQIERERGSYATHTDLRLLGEKLEALLQPVTAFMLSQQGVQKGFSAVLGWIFAGVGSMVGIVSLILYATKR